MKNLKQAQKVLDMIRDRGQVAKNDVDTALMKAADLQPDRLAVYIHEINARLGVRTDSVKDGRKVVAYKLAVLPEMSPAPAEA